jgi:peptidoglycan/LPS O-acetylase OafA/YrhL
MNPSSHYRPEIDGLRAVSVLSVIAFHLNPNWLSGGFLGVDIFFVISGYLITKILLSDLQGDRFNMRRFYERRARRILPALIVVVAACIPIAWLLMDATELQAFGQSLLTQIVFASNILFWQGSGYFAAPAETIPLLHTWSLAVEEQFYLLFPALLFIGWRYVRRHLAWIILALAALSLATAEYFVWLDPSAAFYLFPFRGWELLAGALLAHREVSSGTPARSRWTDAAALLGLAVVIYSLWSFGETRPHPSLQTLPLIIGACLVVRYGRSGPAHWALSLRPVVAIGLISYSLYLWHWPLLAFTRLHNFGDLPPHTWRWFLPVTFALSWASWRFVETPFRFNHGTRSLLRFSWSSATLTGVIGVALLFAAPTWTFRNLTMTADQKYIYSFIESKLSRTEAYEFGTCFRRSEFTQATDKCSNISETGLSVILWGDSHAAALAYGMRKVHPNLAVYTTSDCSPIVGYPRPRVPYCKPNNDYVIKRISELRPKIVMLAANWIDTEPLSGISGTISAIRSASPHTSIIILGGVPQWQPSLPEILLRESAVLQSELRIPTDTQQVEAADLKLSAIGLRSGVEFLPILPELCANGDCLAFAQGSDRLQPFAWDYGHLTTAASMLLAHQIFAKICHGDQYGQCLLQGGAP